MAACLWSIYFCGLCDFYAYLAKVYGHLTIFIRPRSKLSEVNGFWGQIKASKDPEA
jgi:hypothetical protein